MKKLIKKSVLELKGYVPGEQPKGLGLIKLNTNENPYPPSPAVQELIKYFPTDLLRLYPDPLSLDLRSEIAKVFGCKIENIFIGNGSDEILALSTRAYVENGGSVAFFSPSYSLYPVLTDIASLSKKPINLTDDFKFTLPSDYNASLFFLANPNAPTGMSFPKDKIKELCRTIDGVVLIDEAYADFSDDNCLDIALDMENVMVVRTMSKSFSLAGIRLGYAIGHKNLIDALYKIKDSYNVDKLSQAIALVAFKDIEYMRKNVIKIRETRDRLANELKSMNFHVFDSQTNFLWVKPVAETAYELFNRLKNNQILVRYFDDETLKDYIRITVGTDSQVDRLLDIIKQG